MTIEELERGMKLLFDQQVHFADDIEELRAAQGRTNKQIAELTDTQNVTMKAITTVVAAVGGLAEAQKRTDETVAALAHRIDAFIAALGNGHKNPQ